VDGIDEESVTKHLMWGRQNVVEFWRYYRNYLKGYQDLVLTATGEILGIRETRRIIGDYILNLDDFKRRAVFDDEIGRYNYPVDIHPLKPDKLQYQEHRQRWAQSSMGKGESYGIPYRILTPIGLDNVLVAGRCVSTDRWVFGSLRVQPGCFITGQAAGMAAAIAASANIPPRDVQVKDLQQRLKRIGAFLPNAQV
jgi:hypothetical protein